MLFQSLLIAVTLAGGDAGDEARERLKDAEAALKAARERVAEAAAEAQQAARRADEATAHLLRLQVEVRKNRDQTPPPDPMETVVETLRRQGVQVSDETRVLLQDAIGRVEANGGRDIRVQSAIVLDGEAIPKVFTEGKPVWLRSTELNFGDFPGNAEGGTLPLPLNIELSGNAAEQAVDVFNFDTAVLRATPESQLNTLKFWSSPTDDNAGKASVWSFPAPDAPAPGSLSKSLKELENRLSSIEERLEKLESE